MPNHRRHEFPILSLNPVEIIAAIQPYQRCLLFGPMGIGKSTLAAQLAATLSTNRHACWCLSADPGTPAFGVPGAVALAKWQQAEWQVIDTVALCSLDAGRFRLPLVSAVRTLLPQLPDTMGLIDAPGVVRGVAGKELLEGLVDAAGVDCVLVLTAPDKTPPLRDELRSLSVDVHLVRAATTAQRPGQRRRARQRTAQWDQYLSTATEYVCDLSALNVIGTPPPLDETHSWIGRQFALLHGKRTLAMGEVQSVTENRFTLRLVGDRTNADTLLIRDAVRNPDGLLETAIPFAVERFAYLPPADVIPDVTDTTGPRVVGRVGAVDVALINGVFGDPLLHCRVRQQRRSFLFDLGDGSRLPARVAHQVSDVFITHAHLDHIGGFLWLLRSRLGDYPACRLYGPPGLAQHIAGFLQGVLWDRIAEAGPRFEVFELHGDRLQRSRLQAGYAAQQSLGEVAIQDNVIFKEAGFQISAITLDHHGTAVFAYAFQPDKQLNVRKDRLRQRGWEPGPWLTELKQQLLAGATHHKIQLPDHTEAAVDELATELIIITPGKKLVYATDLADSPANRQQLIQLAQHAHTLFCEAAFMEQDAEHAARNGHLTTRACGEIATAAAVARLVPFHFSRRYIDTPQQVYDELKRYCARVFSPKSMAVFATTKTSLQPVISFNNEKTTN